MFEFVLGITFIIAVTALAIVTYLSWVVYKTMIKPSNELLKAMTNPHGNRMGIPLMFSPGESSPLTKEESSEVDQLIKDIQKRKKNQAGTGQYV